MPGKSKDIQIAIKDEAHWKTIVNKTTNRLVGKGVIQLSMPI
jgi:hypothetical protein